MRTATPEPQTRIDKSRAPLTENIQRRKSVSWQTNVVILSAAVYLYVVITEWVDLSPW